ncbi:GTPase HflX [bacterium]|nr:GTPase HflX [bacterium]
MKKEDLLNEEILAERGYYEKAYLVGIRFAGMSREETEEHLDELESLTGTLGAEVAGRELVSLAKPSSRYLVGDGTADRIATLCEELEVDVLIFDDDLTPAQQRLWEKKTSIAVIDRRKVILDIFAARAQTKEAQLQIELARLQYMLPRLKRAWTHLERQRGGGGFIGGAGEAQIEVDRRLVRDRIASVRRELASVRKHRDVMRARRERKPVPTAALVGYTNSGKSSLLNTLTEAHVLEENKLFATLDATTRRIELPNNQEMLLTDTVGFIRKLPHSLIEAFRSTLEEATAADFLLHVVDASHTQALEHVEVTQQVLEELGASDRPMILVLNKADLVEDRELFARFENLGVETVITSTLTRRGIDELCNRIASLLNDKLADLHLRIPASRFDIVSALHRDGEVLEEKYGEDNDVLMHVLYPRRFASKVEQWVVVQR